LKLIEGELELGIGFQGPGFTAQIFGAINGEIPIYISFEKTGPEEFEDIPIGIEGEIKGEIGARLEAHYILKAQSTIETKISAKPKIFVNKIKGLHGKIIISWSGIEAKIECGVGEGGSISSKEGFSEKKYTIMPDDPELKCIQFPPEKKFTPTKKELNYNDIYDMVLESLNKEWEIRVFKENEWYKADERIDNSELSKIIANKIFNQKDLKKEYKIIEGLLVEIREELNKLGSRIFRRDWISKSSFDDFCNNKLNEIINFKSPELQMINQIKEA
jgi:hypothetical protein